jgi:hypothetical protein
MMSIFNGRAGGLDRVLRKHRGETGVIVAGWLGGHVLAPNDAGYHVVYALIDGRPQKKSTVYPRTKRPQWVAVPPGRHEVKLANQHGVFHAETAVLAAAEVLVLSVRGPDVARYLGLRNRPRIWVMRASTDPRNPTPRSAKPAART